MVSTWLPSRPGRPRLQVVFAQISRPLGQSLLAVFRRLGAHHIVAVIVDDDPALAASQHFLCWAMFAESSIDSTHAGRKAAPAAAPSLFAGIFAESSPMGS